VGDPDKPAWKRLESPGRRVLAFPGPLAPASRLAP